MIKKRSGSLQSQIFRGECIMRRKLLFYGDSNTGGYDPRSYIGERYPEEAVWTHLVSETLGHRYDVINQGLNGRQVPHTDYEFRHIEFLMDRLSPQDMFFVMLGTNDLFVEMPPDAGIATERMETFLNWVLKRAARPGIALIAPPAVRPEETSDPILHQFASENSAMAEGYRKLAESFGIPLIDASSWDIDFAFDGVHFSEEGHRQFAEHLLKELPQTIKLPE